MSENNSKIGPIISLILLLAILAVAAWVIFIFNPTSDNKNKTATSSISSSSIAQNKPADKCAATSPKSSALIPVDTEKLGRIKIEDIKEGTGTGVVTGDIVCIDYKGTLVDGTEFDSSYPRNAPFVTQIGVGRVIPGWDLGILGLKEGGKRKLTIPSDLAYGDKATGKIPANSILVFEVELVKIIK
jgi:FKBP-type peptidyl-prolyl cis-trans isomerase